jgi:hypothetical protein
LEREIMKNFLVFLGLVICLGMSLGCGTQGTDPSKNTGEMVPEQQTKDVEDAVKSGKINPSTYGKY